MGNKWPGSAYRSASDDACVNTRASTSASDDDSATTQEPTSARSDHFSYIEFGGKDGRTCPTCSGTGRIAKHQEEELVALIPYNDQRLKPSRTKLYVALAVVICIVVCGLILFFLLPRSVSITQYQIKSFNVSIDKNMSSTTINIWNQFNVSNTNFFNVRVSDFDVEVFFDQVLVGSADRKGEDSMVISARSGESPIEVKVVTEFGRDNQLDYVADLCTNPKRKVHDIVVKLQATMTVWYLQHTEQSSISYYRYIDCSLNNSPPDR